MHKKNWAPLAPRPPTHYPSKPGGGGVAYKDRAQPPAGPQLPSVGLQPAPVIPRFMGLQRALADSKPPSVNRTLVCKFTIAPSYGGATGRAQSAMTAHPTAVQSASCTHTITHTHTHTPLNDAGVLCNNIVNRCDKDLQHLKHCLWA